MDPRSKDNPFGREGASAPLPPIDLETAALKALQNLTNKETIALKAIVELNAAQDLADNRENIARPLRNKAAELKIQEEAKLIEVKNLHQEQIKTLPGSQESEAVIQKLGLAQKALDQATEKAAEAANQADKAKIATDQADAVVSDKQAAVNHSQAEVIRAREMADKAAEIANQPKSAPTKPAPELPKEPNPAPKPYTPSAENAASNEPQVNPVIKEKQASSPSVSLENKDNSAAIDNNAIFLKEKEAISSSPSPNTSQAKTVTDAAITKAQQSAVISELNKRLEDVEKSVKAKQNPSPVVAATAPQQGFFQKAFNALVVNPLSYLANKAMDAVQAISQAISSEKKSSADKYKVNENTGTPSTPNTTQKDPETKSTVSASSPDTKPAAAQFASDMITGSLTEIKGAIIGKDGTVLLKGADLLNLFLNSAQRIPTDQKNPTIGVGTVTTLRIVETALLGKNSKADPETKASFQKALGDVGLGAPILEKPREASSEKSNLKDGLAVVRDDKPFRVSSGLRQPRIYIRLDQKTPPFTNEEKATMKEKAIAQAASPDHKIDIKTTKSGKTYMTIEPLTKQAGKEKEQIQAMGALVGKFTQSTKGETSAPAMGDLIAKAITRVNTHLLRASVPKSFEAKALGTFQMKVQSLVGNKPQDLNPHQKDALVSKLQAKLEKLQDKLETASKDKDAKAGPKNEKATVEFVTNDKGKTKLQVKFDPNMDKKEQQKMMKTLAKICNDGKKPEHEAKVESKNRSGLRR